MSKGPAGKRNGMVGETPTEGAAGADVLPVVPVVVHPRDGNHRRDEQREEDDAELGDVAPTVEHGDLPGEVPRQEPQAGK